MSMLLRFEANIHNLPGKFNPLFIFGCKELQVCPLR